MEVLARCRTKKHVVLALVNKPLNKQKKTHTKTFQARFRTTVSCSDLLLVRDVLRFLGLLEGRCERGDGVVVGPALQSCGTKKGQ